MLPSGRRCLTPDSCAGCEQTRPCSPAWQQRHVVVAWPGQTPGQPASAAWVPGAHSLGLPVRQTPSASRVSLSALVLPGRGPHPTPLGACHGPGMGMTVAGTVFCRSCCIPARHSEEAPECRSSGSAARTFRGSPCPAGRGRTSVLQLAGCFSLLGTHAPGPLPGHTRLCLHWAQLGRRGQSERADMPPPVPRPSPSCPPPVLGSPAAGRPPSVAGTHLTV